LPGRENMKGCINFLFNCVLVVGSVVAAGATQVYEVMFERNVPVTMRDGVVLRADVYRPRAEGKFPVLLCRTPYNKTNNFGMGFRGAPRGYVVIIQDCRGRYASEGDWEPFKYESNDGYDTVEWAASLPYSDGKVGTYDASYAGVTQMLLAIASPPHLAGIFPMFTASDYHDNWVYQGGAFQQWFNESWTSSSLAPDALERLIARERDPRIETSWVRTLPLADFPFINLQRGGTLGHYLPYFVDWLKHPRYDDYWKQWSIDEHQSQIRVAAYHVGGWYDIFLGGDIAKVSGPQGAWRKPEGTTWATSVDLSGRSRRLWRGGLRTGGVEGGPV